MVEKWRRPLILSSTRNLLDSVLSSARPEERSRRRDEASSDRSPPSLRLKVGILRFADGGVGGGELSEDSFLVGVSSSVLKKLSITTGSLVSFNNKDSSTADEADSVTVDIDDFMKVLGELSPSLSLSEVKKYELLRDQFEGTLKRGKTDQLVQTFI